MLTETLLKKLMEMVTQALQMMKRDMEPSMLIMRLTC